MSVKISLLALGSLLVAAVIQAQTHRQAPSAGGASAAGRWPAAAPNVDLAETTAPPRWHK